MSNYQLVVLDLDGTILTPEKEITNKTEYWIRKAVDAGVTVIFATGRGIQRTKELWDYLGLKGPMVLANGAEIWEEPGRILERHIIKKEYVQKLHQLAVNNDAQFWGYSIEEFIRQDNWKKEMLEYRWLKFGMRHKDLDIIRKLRQEVRNWGTLEVTRTAAINMEVTPKGITKAYGVQKVCELLGINMDDVMAIGDSLNDLYLIQSVGLGIAMGNADEILKQAADIVTGTNEQDGVAQAIKQYLF